MISGHHFAAAVLAIAGLVVGLWLLLFAGPFLLNVHRDWALQAAVVLYLGVPAGFAWGISRLWRVLKSLDQEDD